MSIRILNLWNQNKIVIDASNTCTLECPRCARQLYPEYGLPKAGFEQSGNLSVENFKKLLNKFNNFTFCGQVSDPIMNPDLIEMLQLIYSEGKEATVMTAATVKNRKEDWYRKAFEAHPKARWVFGIDGLPEESNLYRINQDGEFLYEMMKLCAKICKVSEWQYIVFSYNEDNIETAMAMAKENKIRFSLNFSSRWSGEKDPYKPTIDKYQFKRPDEWKTLWK